MEGASLVDLQGRILDVAEDLRWRWDIRLSNFNLFLVPYSLDGNLAYLLFCLPFEISSIQIKDKTNHILGHAVIFSILSSHLAMFCTINWELTLAGYDEN